MEIRPFILAGMLGITLQAVPAQAPPLVPIQSPPALAQGEEDPFFLPPEAAQFARHITGSQPSTHLKLQALLRAVFLPRKDGGLGMVYDNARTRTVAQVWAEGRANCLSLTAFFVMTCRSLGIREQFAEALNTNHWRKVGSIIQYERHVVALTPEPPANDWIADFVPELRKRYGTYVVAVLPEERFRALFYSNRAVEALAAGEVDAALIQAQHSMDADPKCSVGWNVAGVLRVAQGDPKKAEEAYLKALELDPKDGAAIGNMEALLRDGGRLAEAQVYRSRGETVRKKDPYFHAYLAGEALAEGDMPEADARIRKAIKILPRDPDILLLLARIRLAQGDLDDAIAAIADAKKWSSPEERERYDSKISIIRGMKSGQNAP